MPPNLENHGVHQPGEIRLVYVVPAGKVRRLPLPLSQPFFSPTLMSTLAWSRHSCQSTSLSSAFRLPVVASLTCYLIPLCLIPTSIWRQGWRVSAAILRLLGRPCRLQRRDIILVLQQTLTGICNVVVTLEQKMYHFSQNGTAQLIKVS